MFHGVEGGNGRREYDRGVVVGGGSVVSGAEDEESGDEFGEASVWVFDVRVNFAEDACLSESDSGSGEFGGAAEGRDGCGLGGEFVGFGESGLGGFGDFREFGDLCFGDSGSEKHCGAVKEEGFGGSE